MIHLGTVRPGRTIYIPFESFASATGAPITITNFAVGDIKIYKDGSTTERASTAGFTLLDTDGVDFDGITGIHGFSVDLSDNTTADFYKAGSRYWVVVSTITVDGQTMSFVAAVFRIGYEDSSLDTFIASITSQTVFTLNTGPAEANAFVGRWVCFHAAASSVQQGWGVVKAYAATTKQVTLAAAPTFTIAAGDNVSVMGVAPLQPATAGNTLVVDSAGLADANAVKLGPSGSGTAQTARDVGASVLLSPGTGTGQISLSSGSVTTTYQIKKNTALSNFEFLMTDSANHQPATGLTVTGTVSKDGAAFAALTNAVSEVASGIYKVNLAAADVNANVLTLMFTATGADTTYITIVTQT